ncbi:unnamed protein product, partial [Ectocarpus sp. 12 AP-2014]
MSPERLRLYAVLGKLTHLCTNTYHAPPHVYTGSRQARYYAVTYTTTSLSKTVTWPSIILGSPELHLKNTSVRFTPYTCVLVCAVQLNLIICARRTFSTVQSGSVWIR